MTITLKEVKEQFDIWNKKAFNGELPTPAFELMQTKSLLGQFCPRKVMGVPTYKIRISVYYDRPLQSYIDTIVHEMLHFYIKFKGIKDTSSHGREWKRMAAELSRKFNLTITRTNPAGGGVSEAVIEKKKNSKCEYVTNCIILIVGLVIGGLLATIRLLKHLGRKRTNLDTLERLAE